MLSYALEQARTEARPAWKDGSEDHCLRNGALCATECPTSFLELPHSLLAPLPAAETGKEARTHALALHRGFASVSHPPLVKRLFAKFAKGLGSGRYAEWDYQQRLHCLSRGIPAEGHFPCWLALPWIPEINFNPESIFRLFHAHQE